MSLASPLQAASRRHIHAPYCSRKSSTLFVHEVISLHWHFGLSRFLYEGVVPYFKTFSATCNFRYLRSDSMLTYLCAVIHSCSRAIWLFAAPSIRSHGMILNPTIPGGSTNYKFSKEEMVVVRLVRLWIRNDVTLLSGLMLRVGTYLIFWITYWCKYGD